MTTTFKAQLNTAFKTLRAAGYFARQNWQCCTSCGCNAIPDGQGDRYAFYHRQDTAALQEAMEPRAMARRPQDVGVYIAWDGDGQAIADAFRAAGCTVEWNGTGDQKMWVADATCAARAAAEAEAAYVAQVDAACAA